MMRMIRLRMLQELADGRSSSWRGLGNARAWLYAKGLVVWEPRTSTVLLTDAGRISLERAKQEYALRPKHVQPRKWQIEMTNRRRFTGK